MIVKMLESVIGEEDMASGGRAIRPGQGSGKEKRIESALDIFPYGNVLFRHGKSEHHFRCLQRGCRAPPARDSELSWWDRAAGWGDRGSVGMEQPSVSKHLRV